MKLCDNPFSLLIPHFPAHLQTIRVRRSTWEVPFAQAGLTGELNRIFGQGEQIGISRRSIRGQEDVHRKCLEILLWGYPRGMRGNQHLEFLCNLQEISVRASLDTDWATYFKSLNDLGGLGISTITKLAYFFDKFFEGDPALILDSRILRVLAHGEWMELQPLRRLAPHNAARNYLLYLSTIASVAHEIPGVSPDQLEFFLFSLGDAFENPPKD